MEYLKIFTDFAEAIEPLSDAEKGRLFTAMLEYARRGTEPQLLGNERILWPTAKLNIDREAAFLLKQRENGARGGRPKNPTKPTETQLNPTKPNLTQQNLKRQRKDKDKEKKDISSLRSEISYVADPELNAAILDFITYRKAAKKPMTDRAISMLLTKLDSMASTTAEKVAILQQSIFRGWTGVFPIKREQSGNVFLDIAREEGIV